MRFIAFLKQCEKMKKKKANAEEMKQKNTTNTADNKDNRSQEENSSAEINGADTETVNGREDKSDTASATTGSKSVSDKDAKKEVSPEEKLAEMQDRYLRLSAEFDNYRKRTLREKMELTKHAGENIFLSIIPVMDDFERALKLMETATDCSAMKSGIDLIYTKFSDFLKQNGIKEIESVSKEFDVDHHEAVTKVSVEDESMKGKVVDVIVKGYWLHDKVLRFSKVVVGE
jgi:molecular chaperone GrpE